MSTEEFEYKQVIAVRLDLKMGRGKIAVQVGHAAVSSAEVARKTNPKWWHEWMREGQCKVAVKVKALADLSKLKKKAVLMGLPNSLVKDRGLTQLPPGTATCLGIGPAPTTQVDKITGEMPLL